MSSTVTQFFAPKTATRPANFVVVKFFLLGLLISNSIESILIIPKILDVLDANELQQKEFSAINIKRDEIKETLEEQQMKKEVNKEYTREKIIILKEAEEAIEEEKEGKGKKVAKAKAKEGKEKGQESEKEEKEEEKKEEEEEKKEKAKKNEHKKLPEKTHFRSKRPPKRATGTNLVSVFMLFYGATTLCLGVVAVFKEQALLIMILMGVTFLGVCILISAGFSVIMLLSVSKDCLIGVLSYKYLDMVKKSDPLPGALPAAFPPNVGMDPAGPYDPQYSQQQQ